MILLFSLTSPKTIFEFNETCDLQNWRIVNDVVMGGLSSSTITLNSEGHGVFEGDISLENNGGFSSLRHSLKKIEADAYTGIRITLKGDGKDYQFRIKDKANTYYSYIGSFTTSGDWQEIEIPFATMHPQYRGRKLDMPNFKGDTIEEITFLIGNKKEEAFKLIIDTIVLL